MLSLIPSPSSFTGRTAHRKGARRAENHFHTDRSHSMGTRSAVHLQRGEGGGDRSKIIAHHKSIISIVQGAIYILDHEAFFIRTRNRLPVSYTIDNSNTFPPHWECKVHGLSLKNETGSLWGQGNLWF